MLMRFNPLTRKMELALPPFTNRTGGTPFRANLLEPESLFSVSQLYPFPSIQQFLPESLAYFAAVEAAGGEVTHKRQVNKLFSDYIDAGYWDKMQSSALFMGVTFPGCFVRLKPTMPVVQNVNFTADRHDPTTGLRGNGSDMRIDTNVAGTDLGLNDASAGVYITGADTQSGVTAALFGDSNLDVACLRAIYFGSGAGSILARIHSTDTRTHTTANRTSVGLLAASCSASQEFLRAAQITNTFARSGAGRTANNIRIFARLTSNHTDARLATYWLGQDITSAGLANIEAIQNEFVLSINPAIFD